MTQLVCPLCGRFVSLKKFDPSRFVDDIYTVEVTGLGRGKGVKVTEKTSILQPGTDTIEVIKQRILRLCKILIESGCLRREDVLSKLGIETVDLGEVYRLTNEVGALEAELEQTRSQSYWSNLDAEALKTRMNILQRQLGEKESDLYNMRADMNDMVNSVEETLAASGLAPISGWDVDEENPAEILQERLNLLIREYQSLEAEYEQQQRTRTQSM